VAFALEKPLAHTKAQQGYSRNKLWIRKGDLTRSASKRGFSELC
jgi:hypothetical protein